MATADQRPRSFLARLHEEVQVAVMLGVVRIFSALPSRWVIAFANGLGIVIYYLDGRGRNIAYQNLDVVFGDGKSKAEKRRIVKASFQMNTRSILLLLNLQPLTREKLDRWIDLPANLSERNYVRSFRESGGVLVSGHIGNWELLLGIRVFFMHFPPVTFVAEAVPHRAVNRVLAKLRGHGDLVGTFRKGGARAATAAVKSGGIAAILADRSVRATQGGIYAPFMGLPCRTTPLPGWLGVRYGRPVIPLFMLPKEGGRFDLWVGPDLARDLTGDSDDERVIELTTRINDVLAKVIRAQPEAWNWTLKRFKARPHQEMAGYPPYCKWEPDTEARAKRFGS